MAPFNRARDALMIARDGRKVGVMPRDNFLMDSPESRAFVSVGWSKHDQLVQVGVTLEPTVKGDPEYSAWADFPDRETINGLIRSLRKARDAAFGKDA
ncbi:hypothetical protein PBI_GAIA_147 [Mycobacterium phage Gaia]|uniref:Uncharacterized protein n=1 Tax=Mycobacterium phage Gaia TaxID=1486472 RepID=A0A068F8X5_9CAUD|nr:hypothetical protein VC46_gp087 [Mycobacterium phage Gaia]AID58965.1 hypothetical protein PBI_GAIA_147 [Mycobacterium phage Gaia]